jgi:hypothetical protein
MKITKTEALKLIDTKITQFKEILENATIKNRYDKNYKLVYYGTEQLIKELFSEQEIKNFRGAVTTLIGNKDVLKDYQEHINDCIAQLEVYKEKIQNFWEDSSGSKLPYYVITSAYFTGTIIIILCAYLYQPFSNFIIQIFSNLSVTNALGLISGSIFFGFIIPLIVGFIIYKSFRFISLLITKRYDINRDALLTVLFFLVIFLIIYLWLSFVLNQQIQAFHILGVVGGGGAFGGLFWQFIMKPKGIGDKKIIKKRED